MLLGCRSMTDPRPVLIYDATCAFCRKWIARWHARTDDRVDYVPLQRADVLRRLQVPTSSAARAVQLVMPDGRRYEGAEAIFRALEHAPGLRLASRLGRLPVLRWIAARVYRWIASHRIFAAQVERIL